MSPRPCLILIGLLASAATAAPAIDPQFSNHAVIQRDRTISLSGTAAPHERVSVSFAGTRSEAVADAAGRWKADFTPRSAGGPYSIDLDGTPAAEDVMVGDVWLCSGQ